MNRWRVVWKITATTAAAGAAALLAVGQYRDKNLPRNFGVVAPGVLYRSGQMRTEHFRRIACDYKLRTVVALNPFEQPEEEALCKQLGVRFIEMPMPGNGRGRPELFHEFLKLLGDPANQPVLVHCHAGAMRTGAAVALYRMHYEGWSFEDAVREMAYYGCQVESEKKMLRHLQACYDSIPPSLRRRVEPVASTADASTRTAR